MQSDTKFYVGIPDKLIAPFELPKYDINRAKVAKIAIKNQKLQDLKIKINEQDIFSSLL